MKRLLLIPFLALTLALASCAQIQKAGNFVATATQTFVNPLGSTDIYRVQNVYAAGLTLAVEYRNYCWSKPYAVLMVDPIARPICQNRRPVVRAIQAAKGNAFNAIRVADNFIRANPTGNAVSYISAAWSAVQDFRATIPVVK